MNALIGELGKLEWLALVKYYGIGSVVVFVHKTGSDSEEFRTVVGVKQGGPFSPTGFNKHIDKLIVKLIESEELLVVRKVKCGCIVYADDTTAITHTAAEMHKTIERIVEYCKKYDLVINEKKTQWLKLGDPVREEASGKPIVVPASDDEIFKINGTVIEKVDRFKLLGIWTMSNGSNRVHIMKRIQAAYAPIPGLNELGLNDPKTDPKIIGTLISSYIRPRIMYGIEAIELNNQERDDLIKCEAKIIKRAMNLPNNSYNTPIYEMLEIVSLDWALKKRKITFFKQLMENKVTRELLLTRESAQDYIFYQLDTGEQGDMDESTFMERVIRKCDMELQRINGLERGANMSDHAKIIKELWMNRSRGDNE